MCLYPKLIFNRKYKSNKKNKGKVPQVKDIRTLYVPVGCGKCMECKHQRARAWSIRLQEEIKHDNTGQFTTLTFSNEAIFELSKDIKTNGYERDNQIAKLAVRRFLERWRKKYKVSVKHWLVTELGHEGTQNIHLHGLLFTKNKEDIAKIWQYGIVHIGEYVNEKSVNYFVKYAEKTDKDHPNYNAIILTSPAIGRQYINTYNARTNKFKGDQTDETYQTRTGDKINLPVYWRNQIYTEEQREKLWIQKLDKGERWINGIKVKTDNVERITKVLIEAQEKNKRLGYGDDSKDWTKIQYENQLREINFQKRVAKFMELLDI